LGRLDGKVALITGGESGIGLATARRFAREGARLHLVGIDAERLSAAVGELAGAATSSLADVASEEAVAAAVGEGAERHGRFDVLFSNAGISGDIAPLTEFPSDGFARVLAVHVLGAFHVLKHGIPHVRDGGSIVITSSVVGLIGAPEIAAYATAKHAQVGLMRVAANELAGRRIRVNTLHPGPTSTPFQDDIEMRATGRPQAEAEEAFNRMIPLGRHATPEEIADAVVFLASDESAMITSHTLSVDGGMSG
jgi:NAD(P)-dependent dehydrogenase (short-subunit alcohol dehydrogenase family)